MQGLNEIAENDPSIIEKTVKDLQSVSANINSYDTMIDMFIKSNSDLADNLANFRRFSHRLKMFLPEQLMLLILPINLLIMSQMILQTRLMRSLKL